MLVGCILAGCDVNHSSADVTEVTKLLPLLGVFVSDLTFRKPGFLTGEGSLISPNTGWSKILD